MAAKTWTDEQLRSAVAASFCWADVLRCLGLRPAGGNTKSIQRNAERLGLSTAHFDPDIGRRRGRENRRRPLEDLLVEGSGFSRYALKQRLFAEGLKDRRCELCGQDEQWRGRPMALILDHINGVADDNRLENLRVVCPNCNATFDTHCGRNAAVPRERQCLVCATAFRPHGLTHRFCSIACAGVANGQRLAGVPQPERRKVQRPPIEQLLAELEATSYVAVGRRYGVSDNAVRKWVRGATGVPEGR